MYDLTGGRRAVARTRIVVALCALITACTATTVAARAASAGSDGCGPFVSGTVIPIPCSTGSGTAGTPGTIGSGSSGSASTSSCITIVYTPAQIQQLGLGPAPAGQAWAELACGGGTLPGVVVILVSTAGGTPQVTPQQLMVQAYGELRVPSLSPATAPPVGRDGLVGLPEWFWIPAAAWHPRSVTVSAGPVWATVTATPVGLTVVPGAGVSPVSCQGPGTPYDAARAAAGQHSACTYTYAQPSAGLPGNVYAASVSITWRVDWVGSGGAGGVLAPALSVPVPLMIPVAQAEALVTTP